VTTEAAGAGTGTEDDEGYLERLLLMHPDLDPGDQPSAPAPTPAPAPPAAVHALVGVGGHAGPAIAYDGDGWISVVPDEPAPVEPPPLVAAPTPPQPAPPPAPAPVVPVAGPPPWWRRNAAYLAIVLIIAVVVAGMALAPGGERPVLLSGAPTTKAPAVVDPLTQEWRLEKINLQFSEVEKGYVQVFDGSIDPSGTDGCTQPTRKDGVVGVSRAAYAYRPDNLDGFAAGHVASMVTVFDNADAAARRVSVERQPEYLSCLAHWDEATWFNDPRVQPTKQTITPVPAALSRRTLVGARYTATYKAPDGASYPAYTDHIVVTTGRVRVWLELSSVLYPFDPDQRDLILDHILDRVDGALD
jgi:hypothetical protein